jgi:hypothetical protein
MNYKKLIQNAEFWEAKDKNKSLQFYEYALKLASTIEDKLVIRQKIDLMLRAHEIADWVTERSVIEDNFKDIIN